MPIYDRSYRAYEGELHRGLAWWVIVRQELRVLFATRAFILLLVLAGIHVAFRVGQVVVSDTLSANPDTPLAKAVRGISLLAVNERMFFEFLEGQSTILFWILLFAGSGMICNDIRYNLMEVYFSKPITWRDYALGKIMTLVLIGILLTAVPGAFLVVLHNVLAPGWETLRSSSGWPISIILFSVILVVPCSLAVLAGSALLRSQRTAGISVFVFVLLDLSLAESLSDLFKNPNYNLLGVPLAIYHLGALLFHQHGSDIRVSWWWSALVVLAVSAAILGIICRKVRRCEVAS